MVKEQESHSGGGEGTGKPTVVVVKEQESHSGGCEGTGKPTPVFVKEQKRQLWWW